MRMLHKVLLHLIALISFIVILYSLLTVDSGGNHILMRFDNWTQLTTVFDNKHVTQTETRNHVRNTTDIIKLDKNEPINVWCIFAKVTSNIRMKNKFNLFLYSLFKHSSVDVSLHVITDILSKNIAEEILTGILKSFGKEIVVSFYDAEHSAEQISDIVSAMQPHFSSLPGSYYSDALFFLSLGLYRIAEGQSHAIMFDIDTKLLADVADLYKEFSRFGEETLMGMAPELTPVYRHVLYMYRSKHKATVFGEPAARGGFPGVNSGVILLRLDRMRTSREYQKLIEPKTVTHLATKYSFRGHLGDQDFVTLVAMERPALVCILPCNWNRQLCTWWRNHGYRDVFDSFFQCEGPVYIYHGNCNTPIPA